MCDEFSYFQFKYLVGHYFSLPWTQHARIRVNQKLCTHFGFCIKILYCHHKGPSMPGPDFVSTFVLDLARGEKAYLPNYNFFTGPWSGSSIWIYNQDTTVYFFVKSLSIKKRLSVSCLVIKVLRMWSFNLVIVDFTWNIWVVVDVTFSRNEVLTSIENWAKSYS